MPLPEVNPTDREFMNHHPEAPGLGRHPSWDPDEECGARTARAHEHPEFGMTRWRCTREKGHLGRHEAGVDFWNGSAKIAASWAHKPE